MQSCYAERHHNECCYAECCYARGAPSLIFVGKAGAYTRVEHKWV
jgi:hypothetical protein